MSKWKERIPGLVISVILLAVIIVFWVILLQSKMIPTKLLILGGIALALFAASAVLLVRSVRHKGQFVCGTALAAVLAVVLGFASNYIAVATGTLTEIGSVRTEYTPMAVYVRTEDPAQKLEDTKSYTFGILETLDRDNTDSAVEQLKTRFGGTVSTKSYAGITQLVDGLLNKECGAVIMNTAYLDVITESDKYADVEQKIRELEVLHVETATQSTLSKTETAKTNENPDSRIYTLYISGSDTRQGLNTVGRSDVNILATINTETRQILLVTTPRDYYVPLPISDGIPDKLTHAGIYGVNVSMGTLEMLYDTTIDYYFRLNFSGFTGIVDALGGITVNNDIEFSKNGYDYPVGNVTMDGAKALTFARERYSFADGDIQRGKNQLKVISAIIDKALSPEILVRYNSIMDSIKDCFEMDVPYDDIAELVRRQLSDNGSWNVVQYSVTGYGDTQMPYSMSDYAYVMRPNYDTVNKAKELMQAVKDGKTIGKSDTNITDADLEKYATMTTGTTTYENYAPITSDSSNDYTYDEYVPEEPAATEEPSYEEPSATEEPAPVEPDTTEEPTPVEPDTTEEPTPVEPDPTEEPTPVEPDPTEEPAPVETDPTEEPAPEEPAPEEPVQEESVAEEAESLSA